MNVVLIIGIILSFFQFLLLINKRGKSLPDKILALGIFTVGVHLLSYYLYFNGYWEKYPHLIGLTVPFPLLYGPVLFLYTHYSVRKDSLLQVKDYFHFFPALFSYVYMIRFFFFYPGEEKLAVINGEVDDFALFTSALMVAYVVSGVCYAILAYVKIINYKQLVDSNFSCDDRIKLDWLKYSIWGMGAIFVVVAIILSLREGLGFEFPFNADFIFYTLIVILVFCIGFFGIQHQNIFSNSGVFAPNELVKPLRPGEYKKSGLKPEAGASIHEALLQVMRTEKPYLNPRLTLANLAGRLDVSTNYLSQTINQFENVNFHDFINKYRVDEFINRAGLNKNFSILGNALESGFNSKSSFNIVFKKIKGVTPSKYLDSLGA